jgi:hypothetical protein
LWAESMSPPRRSISFARGRLTIFMLLTSPGIVRAQ